MDFVMIRAKAEGEGANFGLLRNYEDSFMLKKGASVADEFPAAASFQMSDEFPDDLELHEVPFVLGEHLVVSRVVKDFFEEEGVKDIEFLSVQMINHKGRKVKAEYFLVNSLKTVDCIDQDATEFSRNRIDPTRMKNVSNLTIDETRLDPGADMFRMEHLTRQLIIRRSLAEAMRERGFRGFVTSEISEFTS